MSKQQVQNSFDLLALPWPALVSIVKCLEARQDKLSLMAACRTLLDVVLRTAATALLFVSNINHEPGIPLGDASDMFLGQGAITHDSKALPELAGVRDCILHLEGQLSCLVPHFIARACPNMTKLCFLNPKSFCIAPGPLPLCTSLQELRFCGLRREPYPPIPYTASELSSKLPNIRILSCIDGFNTPQAMIKAWGKQLVQLCTTVAKDDTGVPVPDLQDCINVQGLVLNLIDQFTMLPLPVIAQDLTDLKISGTWMLQKQHMKQLMQLPSLTTLEVPGIDNLDEDLREYACCWQLRSLTVSGRSFAFVCLGQLPLQRLEKLTFYDEVTIWLPNTFEGDSLDAVQASVANTPNLEEVAIVEDPDVQERKATKVILRTIDEEPQDLDQFTLGRMLHHADSRLPVADVCDLTGIEGGTALSVIGSWGGSGIESLIIPTVWVFDSNRLQSFADMEDLSAIYISYIQGSQAGLPDGYDQLVAIQHPGKAARVAGALWMIGTFVQLRLVFWSQQYLNVFCDWPCPEGTYSELFTDKSQAADTRVLSKSEVAQKITTYIKDTLLWPHKESVCFWYNEINSQWGISIEASRF